MQKALFLVLMLLFVWLVLRLVARITRLALLLPAEDAEHPAETVLLIETLRPWLRVIWVLAYVIALGGGLLLLLFW